MTHDPLSPGTQDQSFRSFNATSKWAGKNYDKDPIRSHVLVFDKNHIFEIFSGTIGMCEHMLPTESGHTPADKIFMG
jgi:hypothetical protein